jgi:hypothetical protein
MMTSYNLYPMKRAFPCLSESPPSHSWVRTIHKAAMIWVSHIGSLFLVTCPLLNTPLVVALPTRPGSVHSSFPQLHPSLLPAHDIQSAIFEITHSLSSISVVPSCSTTSSWLDPFPSDGHRADRITFALIITVQMLRINDIIPHVSYPDATGTDWIAVISDSSPITANPVGTLRGSDSAASPT